MGDKAKQFGQVLVITKEGISEMIASSTTDCPSENETPV